MEQKFKELLEKSNKILVTSHISPDPDALCSALLVLQTLKLNHPDKNVRLVLEEAPNRELNFLQGYERIEFKKIIDVLNELQPDLLIMVDANRYDRVSRQEGEQIKQFIKNNGIKTVIIDHHEPHDKDETDGFINEGYPASAQQVYETLFNGLRLKKPEGYANTAMLGLLTDTGRFKYKNPRHRETFALVSDLLDAGADIEALENQLGVHTKQELMALAHLIHNMSSKGDYNYSFFSDDFISSSAEENVAMNDLKSASELFVDQFIRSTAPNKWGFVVGLDPLSGPEIYSIGLRAQGGGRDVSLIAKALGGGGHKPAAGARFKASSLDDALARVFTAIEKTPAF